jgi:glycosyltransferase involved in cell wall biosynthesis
MRVAHIITRLVIGGAQENTLATVIGLRDLFGMEVRLISGPTVGPEGSLEPLASRISGFLTIVPELVRPVHPLKDFVAYCKLIQVLRQQRPDLVHTHSGKAGFIGRLAARRAAVPLIVHHIHGPSFGPWQGTLPNLIFQSAERIAARATDHFLCSAAAMGRIYQSAGIGSADRFTRVFSGFDVESFAQARASSKLRSELGLHVDDFVVGKIARLAPLKGHGDLIAAAPTILSACPNARFLILGDGKLRGELERQVEAAGLKAKFIFTGMVAPSMVPEYAAIMDCVVHLSYREALSRAVPQALAAGKPVIAYDFDGANEVCLHGETGFLVRIGDIAGAAGCTIQLAGDPALRTRMGARGQALVSELFTVERMVRQQFEIYHSLALTKGIK